MSLKKRLKVYKNSLKYTNPRPFVARLRPGALIGTKSKNKNIYLANYESIKLVLEIYAGKKYFLYHC